MSRFEKCPRRKLTDCNYWEEEKCEGCPIYTAYYIGRADALAEQQKEKRNDLE